MKKINVFLIGMLFLMLSGSVDLWGQLCEPPQSASLIDINNVKALFRVGENHFNNLSSTANFEVPKGSGKTSILSSSLWIGGIESNSKQLKVAANKYNANGYDYWAGPLRSGDAYINNDISKQYDQIWKITREQVESFKYAFDNGMPSTYTTPNVIKSWAGDHPFNDGQLAPYFDRNSDGIYNWEDGDYPIIKGDQMLWWVINDNGNIHTETNGTTETAIGVEIRVSAYAYNKGNALDNTIFVDYKVINQSSFTLEDTYIGLFTDFDLGYAFDDYIGCDVNLNSYFAYNGDDFDGTGSESYSYGNQPPAQGVTFLQGPYKDNSSEKHGMTKFMYWNNGGGNMGDPVGYPEFYNYLSGRWKDGTKLMYGGNGYYTDQNTTGVETDYAFPSESNPLESYGKFWNEENEANEYGDRRALGSMGPFTMEPGDVNTITVAYIWSRAETGGAIASLDSLKSDIQFITDKYDNNELEQDLYEYSLEGKVFSKGEAVTSGKVILYKKSSSFNASKAIKEVDISSDGSYKFTEIPYGIYNIHAIADIELYPWELPTYYVNSYLWEEAYSVNLDANMKTVKVELMSLTPYEIGEASITGNVSYENEDLYENDVFGTISWFKSTKSDLFAVNVVVILYDENDEPMAWTLSDEAGNYSFDNLPYNSYKVGAEKVGFDLKNDELLSLTETTKTLKADFTIEEEDIVLSIFNSNKGDKIDISVYPNPVADKLFFTDIKNVLIEIYNVTGQKVLSEKIADDFVAVSSLKKGFYTAKIEMSNGKIGTFKFVKN